MWVGLSKKIDINLIEEALQMRVNKDDIQENKSEFPLVVSFNYKASNDYRLYSKNLRLAKKLSLLLACKTICDGSYHGENDSPFWCIIWINGKAYLADDCDSVFGGDENGGQVNIIKRVYL